jgi:hypothetical protein
MADKLSLYNSALQAIGERRLASLTERRKARYELDAVWDGGWVKRCLEQGFWNFAMADVKLSYSPSVEPQYGFRFAFDKPEDWCRTFMVSPDETYAVGLKQREDQGAYWFADYEDIYVRYVSNSSLLGGDLSLWTEKFTEYVAEYGASKIVKAITGSSDERERLDKNASRLLKRAQSTDAMNETPRQLPRGTWATSRRGGGRYRDGGSNTNLIG